ncbi:MAG: hypothetical protein KAS21_04410 [Candidatus Aminicenantes bacterium]|nr:hypothetical protein [Candidatus Aminicenantes bacterium]
MKFKSLFIVIILSFSFILSGSSSIKTPEEFFGFKPGTDRMLFDYGELIKYFKLLDKSSPKIKLEQIGISPMGKPIYIAFISSEKNISNLQNIKKTNRKLAIDPGISDEELDKILKDTPVSFLATLSMHSGEVGPSQAAPIIAHDLVTSGREDILGWLDNVVMLMVPNHNPDGMDMVIHHYWKYKDKKYEGSYLPGVYHKYVGHDNNRDFVTLTQTDTKAIAGIYNLEWFPQVMVEKHQMGSNTSRYFVPPNHDPIAENIDAGIWNWAGIFGANMIKDMTKDGLAGVSQHYFFDDYWPGSTETCIWKNVIGFLTEAASVKYATPVYIEQNELRGYGKGLSEYEKSINMPLPWDGGWWRLGDIVKYEISSTYSILKTASNHRADILRYRNEICRKEVERGSRSAPYYYILPITQHDQSEMVSLVNLLHEHGVDTYYLKSDVVFSGRKFNKGDVVVPLSQSFRPFIKEVMESQKYPVRHYTPGGKIIKPYDITSWSLPLHKGVKSFMIDKPSDEISSSLIKNSPDFTIRSSPSANFTHLIFPVRNNESFQVAFRAKSSGIRVERLKSSMKIGEEDYEKGSFLIKNSENSKLKKILSTLNVSPGYINISNKLKTVEFTIPRIGLVETWFHDMDSGWTRFVFDSYSIPFTVIRPADIKGLNLSGKFDVIIFPDARPAVLKKGKYKSGSDYFSPSYPPEYAKGMGSKGLKKIIEFIDKGGIVVSWGASTGLFMGEHEIKNSSGITESFSFPVSDISGKAKKSGLYCPGSFVKINLKKDHPLTIGMGDSCGIFFRGTALFSTSIPNFDRDRRVIGKFPKDKILLSGYCEKEEVLENKSVFVWLKKNKGQLVLMGFNPQFRASTGGTYKLLFNSILLEKLK